MTTFEYVGSELDLFAEAVRWKAYFHSRISPYLGDEVLEVGAGFGGTTRVLAARTHKRWLCAEPDALLAGRLKSSISEGTLPGFCQSHTGTLADLDSRERFDSILYIDVLEHIENDAAEFERAATFLRPSGHLIILCPANQWLFSPFDEAIGHFRRYNKRMYRGLGAPGMKLVRLEYLDCVGLFASAANRMLLKQSSPTRSQINAWDKWMVPVSRWLDPLIGHLFGKSLLGVWEHDGPTA